MTHRYSKFVSHAQRIATKLEERKSTEATTV